MLGKLAQALKPTDILVAPKNRAGKLYTLKEGEYFVAQESGTKGWIKVLMQNGRAGYIRSASAALFPYQVTKDLGSKDVPASREVLLEQAGNAIAALAAAHIGTPYKKGGRNLQKWVGAGEFVSLAFASFGQKLPNSPKSQARIGKPITRLENLRPGDRLYFTLGKSTAINHAGIFVGNGYFIHASPAERQVRMDTLAENAWRERLMAARR